jgi:hypothetical protein
MPSYTSVASLVDVATESASEAKSTSFNSDYTEARGVVAQAEATAALALAVKHAGDAIGMGLKAIADAIGRG